MSGFPGVRLDGRAEAHDEHSHVVRRIVAVRVVQERVGGRLRVCDAADEVYGALIVDDVPQLSRNGIREDRVCNFSHLLRRTRE